MGRYLNAGVEPHTCDTWRALAASLKRVIGYPPSSALIRRLLRVQTFIAQPSITPSPGFGILRTGSLRSPGVNVQALLRSWEDDLSTFWGIDRVLVRGVELDPCVCVGRRKDGVRLRGRDNVGAEGTEALWGCVCTVAGL